VAVTPSGATKPARTAHSREEDLVADTSGNAAWEDAYNRFETPEEEQRKFSRRLTRLGGKLWPREAKIVELFCGRGNGLHALWRLGFQNLEGVDLSPSLLAQYRGLARTYVNDCRQLPFESRSRDVLIVQGGLHHLQNFPTDLETTLLEAQRVLRLGGLFVVVEPWLTPFLVAVHAVCRARLARHFSRKLDALAAMIEIEGQAYKQWLGQPADVRRLLQKYFVEVHCVSHWGKITFIGKVASE
jgi:ubiquinone/menaquinone biosynthesis C-methylase UbiE